MCTDNNPLTYVMTTPNLDAIGHWWVTALAGFDMTIEYLKGADNKIMDILSPECRPSRARPDPESYERAILVARYGPGACYGYLQLWLLQAVQGQTSDSGHTTYHLYGTHGVSAC